MVARSTAETHRLVARGAKGKPGLMRFLAPAASAALIAVAALSATAAVPDARTPSARAGWASVGTTTVGATRLGTTKVGATRLGTTKLGVDPRAAADPFRVVPRGGFIWPLSPRPAVIRRFDPPQDQWSPGHRGVDLSAAVGQPVLSAGDGVVAFSGVIAGGGVIVVRHAGGLRTTYSAVDERPSSSALVHRGDRIGVLSPAPGHCAPLTCLHWGAIADGPNQQSYRDPLSLLGLGHPTLLPLG